jgi:hypothetical protein
MSDDSWHEDATKTVRILQIIVAAMCAGMLLFLVIALGMAPLLKPPSAMRPISLTWVAFAFVGLALIARAILPWILTAKARREILSGTYAPLGPRQRISSVPVEDGGCRDAKYLLPVFQAKTIMGAALFEGCGFFAAIAYLLEGSPVGLGLALALVLGVAAHFPTRSRAIGWVEGQLEIVGQEKMFR